MRPGNLFQVCLLTVVASSTANAGRSFQVAAKRPDATFRKRVKQPTARLENRTLTASGYQHGSKLRVFRQTKSSNVEPPTTVQGKETVWDLLTGAQQEKMMASKKQLINLSFPLKDLAR